MAQPCKRCHSCDRRGAGVRETEVRQSLGEAASREAAEWAAAVKAFAWEDHVEHPVTDVPVQRAANVERRRHTHRRTPLALSADVSSGVKCSPLREALPSAPASGLNVGLKKMLRLTVVKRAAAGGLIVCFGWPASPCSSASLWMYANTFGGRKRSRRKWQERLRDSGAQQAPVQK